MPAGIAQRGMHAACLLAGIAKGARSKYRSACSGRGTAMALVAAMAEGKPSEWRSVRDFAAILLHATRIYSIRLAGSGKVKWDYDKVAAIAADMNEHLPVPVKDLIESPSWKGGAIIRLESAVSRPSASEVSRHYHLLKPWVQAMPFTVPSGFMVTDVLLLLNDLLGKRLFPLKPNESLISKAADEAVKLKNSCRL